MQPFGAGHRIELIKRSINFRPMPSDTPSMQISRGPGRPRQDDSDQADVRDRLLDAATELTAEQGFETCGLREIAARAEVSSGMISYYFGDRQGLYDAMFNRAFDRMSARVLSLTQDPNRSGSDRLDELVRLQVESIAADPWLPKMLVREVLQPGPSPSQDYFAKNVGRGPLMLLVRFLEKEQASGIMRSDFDPRMMALTIAAVSAFPFLMVPIVGEEIGLELDDDFPSRLIEHNQKILALGLRAQTENE